MKLTAIPALTDNYIWLLSDTQGRAVVVDPGEAAPVEAYLEAHQLSLRAILLTHHHADHIGGAASLQLNHHAHVYAPQDSRIDLIATRVGDGDLISLDGPDLDFQVIAVPGHTSTHIAYVGDGKLFCGDALFSLGCGRMFEGQPAQMLASLDRLAALPDALQVCAAHEYTLANGRFALSVDPDNQVLQQRMQQVQALRAGQQPSLPVRLDQERLSNPFLRVDSTAIRRWSQAHGVSAEADRSARFACLRRAKDHFSG